MSIFSIDKIGMIIFLYMCFCEDQVRSWKQIYLKMLKSITVSSDEYYEGVNQEEVGRWEK